MYVLYYSWKLYQFHNEKSCIVVEIKTKLVVLLFLVISTKNIRYLKRASGRCVGREIGSIKSLLK